LTIDDEAANARLWDKIAVAVKGYRGIDMDPNEWTDVTPQIAGLIPAGHKSPAIRGLYQTNFELEQEEEEGFALEAVSYIVKQTFGDYVIRHVFRAPTEAERRDFRRRANETRFARGSRKIRTKILTNLKAYVELYDKLFQWVEGVEIADKAPVAERSRLVDPIWKRGAVDCLMRSFEASLSD
jgi:hypothetical protein